jgi:hypothetical protein
METALRGLRMNSRCPMSTAQCRRPPPHPEASPLVLSPSTSPRINSVEGSCLRGGWDFGVSGGRRIRRTMKAPGASPHFTANSGTSHSSTKGAKDHEERQCMGPPSRRHSDATVSDSPIALASVLVRDCETSSGNRYSSCPSTSLRTGGCVHGRRRSACREVAVCDGGRQTPNDSRYATDHRSTGCLRGS